MNYSPLKPGWYQASFMATSRYQAIADTPRDARLTMESASDRDLLVRGGLNHLPPFPGWRGRLREFSA